MALQASQIIDELSPTLKSIGLEALGWFNCNLRYRSFSGLLIGNRGPAMWEKFSISREYLDGKDDPLNRWTERTIAEVSKQFSFSESICEILYPFGLRVYPFQQWAKEATGNQQSPLGIFIDPQFGLWWALRAAMLIDDDTLFSEVSTMNAMREPTNFPCETCDEKPCISACPVSAVANRIARHKDTPSMVDVKACHSHLDSENLPNCMKTGCYSRKSCPVGQEHIYCEDELKFHMQSFRG